MPSVPPEAGFSFSGISVTNASVVSMRAAIEQRSAAPCGSTTPAFTRSSYLPIATLNPSLPLRFLTSRTIKAPSWPALSASLAKRACNFSRSQSEVVSWLYAIGICQKREIVLFTFYDFPAPTLVASTDHQSHRIHLCYRPASNEIELKVPAHESR